MSQGALSPAVKKRPIGLGGWLDRWARRLVLGQLQRLQRGAICLVEGEQRRTFGPVRRRSRTVVLQVHHPRFFRALALGGTIGAAEAYMQGWWSLRRSAGYVPPSSGQYGVDAAARAGLGPVGRASPRVDDMPSSAIRSGAASATSPPTTI